MTRKGSQVRVLYRPPRKTSSEAMTGRRVAESRTAGDLRVTFSLSVLCLPELSGPSW